MLLVDDKFSHRRYKLHKVLLGLQEVDKGAEDRGIRCTFVAGCASPSLLNYRHASVLAQRFWGNCTQNSVLRGYGLGDPAPIVLSQDFKSRHLGEQHPDSYGKSLYILILGE